MWFDNRRFEIHYSSMKITRHGFMILENDTHISKWVEDTGLIDHGQNIEKTFRRFLRPGDVAVDVGALIGDHTVPYAQIVGPEGLVLAFEPNPRSFQCLQHNTQQFPWVAAYNVGLSSSVSTLYVVENANVGATYLSSDPKHAGNGEIRVGPLDEMALPRVDFMKIDVEGLEVDVLNGALGTIKRCRPSMLIEVAQHQARYGRSHNTIFQWLTDNLAGEGYTMSPATHTGEAQYDVEVVPSDKMAHYKANI